MLLGYNTNGLADHDLESAIELVAEYGYELIAITVDHHALNPYRETLDNDLDVAREWLASKRLEVSIETGARYLLDPRRKHEPTLVSATEEQREVRVDFLRRAIDIAAELNARCVSFWSGTARDDADEPRLLERLAEAVQPVIAHAISRDVVLAFEPEPGHVVDTMTKFERFLEVLGDKCDVADQLGLTIDIGHLHCQAELPISDHLLHWCDRLVNVHIEDMRHGVHEHLMFGEGEIDFSPVIATLREIEYEGPVTVELSRHSHMGAEAAQRAISFLRNL